MTGPRVRLRLATAADVQLLELWRSSPLSIGELNHFGQVERPRRADAGRENSLVTEHGGVLLVERIAGRRPIGTVAWRPAPYGPNSESVAWNIGINLIPDGRHQGFGSEAQRLLADHLFTTTAVHRIEASTDIENLAEQRALERAGFLREGVLRGAQYRAGARHDLVVYAVVRRARSARPSQR
jgi:RimJ/RimL family protein N-acetyltransferase